MEIEQQVKETNQELPSDQAKDIKLSLYKIKRNQIIKEFISILKELDNA